MKCRGKDFGRHVERLTSEKRSANCSVELHSNMSSPNGTGHRPTLLKSLFVGQKLNETLLESVEVVTEVASGARIYDPAAGNHADFIAQAADLVGIVTTEKRGDILIGRPGGGADSTCRAWPADRGLASARRETRL